MKVYNKWVGYLDRNYQNIKAKLLNTLGETVPEITDHSESNILVIIIGMFSGVAEMLNYYIDNMARESFLTTARKYSSVVKLTRLIDYRIKSMVPASVDLEINFYNADNTPYILPANITLPPGLIFNTKNNVPFISGNGIIIEAGKSTVNIPVNQKVAVIGKSLGTTMGDPEQAYSLGMAYVNDSIQLSIAGIPWNYKETLGRSKPTDKDYIVDVSASKEAYIRFGDNINGATPISGQPIVVDYYESIGSLGNVEANTITETLIDFTALYGIPKFTVTNKLSATAGTDYEDIDRIRRSAPLSLRTLYRAVTKQDYEDIALLAPGVSKAKIYYNCGKFVNLYISPNGGGISSTAFLESVENYFENKKMVTTFVKALPVGESQLVINLDVTAKFRRDPIKTRQDVKEALLNMFSYDNSDINKPIRQSDIIALIDNLEKVDYLEVIYISVVPYVRPNNTIAGQLNYELKVNKGSTQAVDWLIKYDGGYFKIYKNNQELYNLSLNEVYTDPENIITLYLPLSAYAIGSEWSFRTLPVNRDINLNDYSIPILKEENLTLTINEQLSI